MVSGVPKDEYEKVGGERFIMWRSSGIGMNVSRSDE